jgi:hypothetical protein
MGDDLHPHPELGQARGLSLEVHGWAVVRPPPHTRADRERNGYLACRSRLKRKARSGIIRGGARYRFTLLGALVGSLAFCLLADARAWAATVSVHSVHSNSFALVYTAALGEANQLTISETGSGFLVADPGAPVTAGTGCSPVDLHTALCAGVSELEIDLRDRDDRVEFPSPTDTAAYFATIHTRNGNDRVFGCRPEPVISVGRGADRVSLCPTCQSVVFGGPGPDVLRASQGLLNFEGGEGNDVLVGGTEPDHLPGRPRA